MASLPAKIFDFQANIPVPTLNPLDDEYDNIYHIFDGTTTGTKLLVKSSDASDPPLELDQVSSGPIAEWKQNGTLKVSINNAGTVVSGISTGTAPFTASSTTVCTGVNADQVDGIEGANIAKLDTHKTAFSISFQDADPSTSSLNTEDRQSFIVPEGASMVAEKIAVRFTSGSHTSGGSITYVIRKRAQNGGSAVDIGSVTLDNTNNTVFQVYTTTIGGGGVSLTAFDTLTFYLNPRSGTITERNVAIAVIGKQKLTT